jgi:hypothetical protein
MRPLVASVPSGCRMQSVVLPSWCLCPRLSIPVVAAGRQTAETSDKRNMNPRPPNRCRAIDLCNPDVSRVQVLQGASSDDHAAKMSQRPRMITLHSELSESVHHCGRQILYAFSRRIEDMVIGTVVFVAFVVATGAAIVKAFEWYQDVLHGPYLKPQD